MKTWVYKITRVDGLEYIGITINLKRRFAEHSKSNRFKMGISATAILAECDTYEQADILEEQYIRQYNTYNAGLNMTPSGSYLSAGEKFNSLGFKYSQESKNKMSASAKLRGNNRKNFEYSLETKTNWSKLRKGKSWAPKKISDDEALKIYKIYENKEISFDPEFLSKLVKVTQRDNIKNLMFEDLVSPNGRPLTLITVYSVYFADQYNVTPACIRGILRSKAQRSPNYDQV